MFCQRPVNAGLTNATQGCFSVQRRFRLLCSKAESRPGRGGGQKWCFAMNDQRKSDAAEQSFVELEGVREDFLGLAGPKASTRMRELASRGQVAYICAIDFPRSRARDAEFVDRRMGERRDVR